MQPAVIRDRAGVVAGDHHQRVVFAVVGARGGPEDTVDHVVKTVEHQVQTDVLGKAVLGLALFLGQVIDVQGDLVQGAPSTLGWSRCT